MIMETNKYEQFFNELLDVFNNTGFTSKENTIKTIKNTILNTCNFKNNNTNKEVLLPQCITIIDFLINNDKTLTKQECIDFQNILSNCSGVINKKIQTLKRQLNNMIVEINNKTIAEEHEDYKKFKQAVSTGLSDNEILDMYLKYKGKSK